MRSTPLDRGAATLGLFVVLAANARYLAGFAAWIDPGPSLEPYYIDLAARPLAQVFADPAWGPLYVFWLKPLRAIFADPLAVFAYNYYALSVALCTVLYVYVLLLTRRAALATGAALFFVVSDLNLPVTSKVCAFALLVVLIGLTAGECVRPGARRASLIAAATLLSAYVRPEMYPAAVLLVGWSVWLAVGESRGARAVLAWPAAVVALLFVSACFPGMPVTLGGGRLLSAVREHFAWNWMAWHGEGLSYAAIWQRTFGDAATVGEALRRDPAAFLHHLGDNARGVVRFLLTAAFDHRPLLAPPTGGWLTRAENGIFALAGFTALALVAARREWRARGRAAYAHLAVPYACLTAIAVVAATLVYPIPHYLVIPAVLLIVAAVLALSVMIGPAAPSRTPWTARFAIAALCVAAVPTPFAFSTASAAAAGKRPVTDAIKRIRALDLPAPVHVLTFTDGIGDLLGDGFLEYKVWQRAGAGLEDYLRDTHIDVIVTTERGRKSFFLDDPYWDVIQLTPQKAGFRAVPVGDPEQIRVWVRDGAGTQRSGG